MILHHIPPQPVLRHPSPDRPHPGRTVRTPRNHGFALVVSLSLMVLLTVIAVGLLSLSAISLRKTTLSSADEQARANAQLALQLAIARLQSLAGPDTRITAPRMPEEASASLDSLPPAYGVWRSWEGSDHESSGSLTGRPLAPDYASKNAPGSPAAVTGNAGDGRFLGWLVSTTDSLAPDPREIPDLRSQTDTGLVPLVSNGSVTDDKRRVFLKPTSVAGPLATKGGLAWWVGGENCKANVVPDPKSGTATSTSWLERARAHAVPSPKDFGLAMPPEIDLPSSGSLTLAATDKAAANGLFHDVTVQASGLLTNAATGGWKRDLSLMTEKYDELPATKLPFFTLKPGQQLEFSKTAPAQTTPSAHPDRPLLYGWSNYPNSPSSLTMSQFPAIVSWDYLRNACTQYRSLTSLNSQAGRTGIPWASASWWNFSGKQYRYEFLDQPRRWPALSRIYLMFSYTALPDTANPANLKAALVMAPVIVLWNPYNQEITIEGSKKFNINTVNNEMTPARFAFTVGTTRQNSISLYQLMNRTNVDFRLNGGTGGSDALTLRPGETRVFSVKDDALVDGASVSPGSGKVAALNLYPGYRTKGGFYFLKIGTDNKVVSAPKDADFKVDVSFDAKISYDGKTGYGSMLEFGFVDTNDPNNGFNPRLFHLRALLQTKL